MCKRDGVSILHVATHQVASRHVATRHVATRHGVAEIVMRFMAPERSGRFEVNDVVPRIFCLLRLRVVREVFHGDFSGSPARA